MPPLRYGWIRRLQRDFPGLGFSLNGGVKTMDEVSGFLHDPDQPPLRSVMLGRAAWRTPLRGGRLADLRGRCGRPCGGRARRRAGQVPGGPRVSARIRRSRDDGAARQPEGGAGKAAVRAQAAAGDLSGLRGQRSVQAGAGRGVPRPPRAADGAKRGKRSRVDVAVLLERIEAAVNDVEALQARWEDAHGGDGALRPWPVG